MKERIAAWLAVTRGQDINTGLDAEEARLRAVKLLPIIVGGTLSPVDVDVDENVKGIVSSLIGLLTESNEPPDMLVSKADAVYQFIRRIKWPGDQLGEQQDLLTECAAAGWAALGLTVSQVTDPRFTNWEIPLRPIDPIPDSVPVLRFHRPVREFSGGDAVAEAWAFLATPVRERSEELQENLLSSSDLLFAVCGLLQKAMNSTPAAVADEVSSLYASISDRDDKLGVFDERDYLLGELALIGGTAYRHLGKLTDAERWLDRADAAFRHTVHPAPLLTKVAYARLALRYDARRYQDVLDLLPSVLSGFERLGMRREVAKSRFLQGMVLKELGRAKEALDQFRQLQGELAEMAEPGLFGMVLVEIGAHHSENGRYDEAVTVYQRALTVLANAGEPMTIAHLKGSIADAYRSQGNLSAAIEAFGLALKDYSELGMSLRVAYFRVLLAEVLVAANRPREAEWEILAALPTIEDQKMVPEGFAAVALLKESVRRRQADPNALRALRDHLKTTS